MKNNTTGNIGLALASVVSLAMIWLSYIFGDGITADADTGICFPSPESWGLSPLFSLLLNAALILGIVLSLQILNKNYNFITTTDTVLQCCVMALICSNPYICNRLCVATLLGTVTLIEFFILFGTYRSRKSAVDFFIGGSVISIAAMFEYAAVPFVIALFLAGVILKSMNFKSLCALGIGIISPWWIAVGFGLVDIYSLNTPELTTVFTYDFTQSGEFILWLNCGVSMLLFLLIALYNSVSLYAGNTKRRLLNNSTLIFGLLACVCIVLDCNNLTSYLGVLYLALAVQLANLFTLHNLKQTRAVAWLLLVIYCASFAGMTVLGD